MLNQYVSEAHRRVIKWTEGGRILHYDLEGNLMGMENHTKANLTKIMNFLKRERAAKTYLEGTFNTVAQQDFIDVKGLDVDFSGASFTARINNTKTATNKVHVSRGKAQTMVQLYVRVNDSFKPNTRYEVHSSSDGSIEFVEFETIQCENLNRRYDFPVLNVYEINAA